MNQFEERARSAASDAHESVTRLAVPELGGQRAPVGRWLALAAAAIGVIAGAVVLWPDPSTTVDVASDTPTATDPPSGRYIVPTPGDGADWQIRAHDFGDAYAMAEPGRALYGGIGDAGTFGDRDVMVTSLRSTGFPGFTDGHETTTVRGSDGGVYEIGGRVGLGWQEGEYWMQIGSYTLTVGELVALADELVLTDHGLDFPAPPAGTELLVDIATPTRAWPFDWQYVAHGRDDVMALSGGTGTPADLLVARHKSGATEAVELRGLTAYHRPTDMLYVWLEDGTVLTMTGDVSVEAAESIVAISREEWNALAASLDDPAEPMDEEVRFENADEVVIFGRDDLGFGDLTEWAVFVDGDELCLEILRPDSSSGSCITGPVAVSYSVTDGVSDVFGYSEVETHGVVVTTSDGERIARIGVTSDQRWAFGAVFARDVQPLVVDGYDAAGEWLWREPLADAGSAMPIPTYPTTAATDHPTTTLLEVDYPSAEPMADSQQALLGSGEVDDLVWRFSGSPDGWFCFELDGPNTNWSTCRRHPIVTVQTGPSEWVVFGGAPPCTDAVAIIGSGGDFWDGVPVAEQVDGVFSFAMNVPFGPIQVRAFANILDDDSSNDVDQLIMTLEADAPEWTEGFCSPEF